MRDTNQDYSALVNQGVTPRWLKPLVTLQVPSFTFLSFFFYFLTLDFSFVAAAAELVLFQKLTRPGVIIPITSDIYDPILDRIQTVGVTWSDSITRY
jgi:hypothetical protein